MARFVLIHGAWHGGWCWSAVANHLRDAGHDVVCPDLPCHGADTRPIWAATLKAYAETASRAASRLSGPAILVGHSLGGLVITEAAARTPNLFAGLVYLCAFAPVPGDRLLTLAQADRAGGVPGAVRRGFLTTEFSADRAAEIFYHQCTRDAQDSASARLRPEPNWPSFQRVSAPQEALPPRFYIECTEDRAISLAHQRWMRDRAGITQGLSIATDHSPFLSDPKALAAALLTTAEAFEGAAR